MMLGLASSGVDARTDVTPGTVVERLLLAPEKAGIGVEVKMGGDLKEISIDHLLTVTCDVPSRKGKVKAVQYG